ncbi:MAG: NADH dehydrogenase [Candidatus Endobugula sp.]|jgi:NADH dehydrogenase
MKVVIVGGGAGGLELATLLGRKLGKQKEHEIVLIDRNSTHLWKPLLHEVAAGSLDAEIDSVSYRAHAHALHFTFKLGTFSGIDRNKKVIHLAPVYDDDDGEEILPQRNEPYDILVMAIGSASNDFGIEGIGEHCQFLDSTQQAIKFHDRLVNQFIRLNRKLIDDPTACLRVAIVGGGATGVELAAELFNSRNLFSLYGLNRIKEEHLQVTLLEAGTRLVSALSEKVSADVLTDLTKIGADIRLNTQVAKAEHHAFITADESHVEADMLLWAAGIKVPDFMSEIEGIDTNRINQVIVNQYLQTTNDPSIYAIGDCAGFKLDEKRWVPPRAQSAHQMAATVGKNIINTVKEKPLVEFRYSDKGSLISLSEFSTVGVLMGNLVRGDTFNVSGKIARIAYISLYRMHQIALHGWVRATLMMVSDKINHILKPRLKLH